MIELLIKILCTLGALFLLIASLGVLRMPDFYSRLSVTVKANTLGVGFILIAAAIYFEDFPVTTKIFAIVFFIYITSPVAAYMISRAAYVSGVELWVNTKYDEIKDYLNKEAEIPNIVDKMPDEKEQREEEKE